ncbi:MAG: IS200/IS605 family transposase [Candidatus Micrarchaeota archaeon]|nr:IS200/IS605 family transposase [Nitrososphaerota archaeon]MDE1833971.1 IS200/IS605 family transposase [Candidatus Micrarchaeota archaeon]
MEYKHNRTSVAMVNYHIVFCPKYRRKLLVGDIKKRLEEIMFDVALENGWEIISREVMPDHVHLFVSADVRSRPEIVVKRFKGRSSRYLRNEFPELLKMPTLWTRSYFLSTAGNVSASTIKKYIEQQWDKI